MTTPFDPLAVLGLAPGYDVAALRRAYAVRLHACRPEDDPEGFARLRLAYEACLATLRRVPAGEAADTGAPTVGSSPEFIDHGVAVADPEAVSAERLAPLRDHVLAYARDAEGSAHDVEEALEWALQDLSLPEQRGLERALARAIASDGPWDPGALCALVDRFGWQQHLLRPDGDPVFEDPAFLAWVAQADAWLPRAELRRMLEASRSMKTARRAVRADLIVAAVVVAAIAQYLFALRPHRLPEIGLLLIAAAALIVVVGLLAMRRLSMHPRGNQGRFRRNVLLWLVVLGVMAGAGGLATLAVRADMTGHDVRPPAFDLPQFPIGRPPPPSP